MSSDCLSNFWTGEAYCVGVSGSTSATTSTTPINSVSSTTTSVTPPGPTQSGIPADCDAYYVAESGDSCSAVESKYGITDAQFHAWNPAVSSDCLSNFWVGEAYCVGVSGSEGVTTTTTGTTTTTATGTVTPPGPTQTGIPSNCDNYYVAQCKPSPHSDCHA